MTAQNIPVKNTTQEHLSLKDIQDNLVLLKNNSVCLIIQTTAINFGLLSEREQEATIFAYAGFLNSLTFPVQILVHSRQKDISTYLQLVDFQISKLDNSLLQNRLKNYRRFIESIIQKNKILDKRFYLVISYLPLNLGRISKKDLLEKAKNDLYPKRDHIISQLQRLGLRAFQLNNQRLIELFYDLYNPNLEGIKFIPIKDYQAVFIEPKTTNKMPNLKNNLYMPESNQPETITDANKSKPFASFLNEEEKRKKELEGQALQEKINQIVQKVTGEPIINQELMPKIRTEE